MQHLVNPDQSTPPQTFWPHRNSSPTSHRRVDVQAAQASQQHPFCTSKHDLHTFSADSEATRLSWLGSTAHPLVPSSSSASPPSSSAPSSADVPLSWSQPALPLARRVCAAARLGGTPRDGLRASFFERGVVVSWVDWMAMWHGM